MNKPLIIPDKIKICTVEEINKKRFLSKWIDEWRDEVAVVIYNEKLITFSSI
jgi:hypothetical protein